MKKPCLDGGTMVVKRQPLNRKEARHDLRRSRSSSAILLHDGYGRKRSDSGPSAGAERPSEFPAIFLAVEQAAPGGRGGLQFLAGLCGPRRAAGDTADLGSPPAGESDRFGEVEERSGGFRNVGTSVGRQPTAGILDRRPEDAGGAVKDGA